MALISTSSVSPELLSTYQKKGYKPFREFSNDVRRRVTYRSHSLNLNGSKLSFER